MLLFLSLFFGGDLDHSFYYGHNFIIDVPQPVFVNHYIHILSGKLRQGTFNLFEFPFHLYSTWYYFSYSFSILFFVVVVLSFIVLPSIYIFLLSFICNCSIGIFFSSFSVVYSKLFYFVLFFPFFLFPFLDCRYVFFAKLSFL